MQLPAEVLAQLSSRLPAIAAATVAQITEEVPAYSAAWQGRMINIIQNAVTVALGGFVDMLADAADEFAPNQIAVDGAYQLGRGEARSGRSTTSLLAAYRTGIKVAWTDMAKILVAGAVPADQIAELAGLVFAYIDQLSAASVSGHNDESEESNRLRQLHLEQLFNGLLTGLSEPELVKTAGRAGWKLPNSLTAMLVTPSQQSEVLAGLNDPRVLHQTRDFAEAGKWSVLFVPDLAKTRTTTLAKLSQLNLLVGPLREWHLVQESYSRVRRSLSWYQSGFLDTEAELPKLVLSADLAALTDLQAQVLAPLKQLPLLSQEKLVETLRAWLLFQGNREALAKHLFLHPQTIRYRVNQLRTAFGDQLSDPEWIAAATIALAVPDLVRLSRK